MKTDEWKKQSATLRSRFSGCIRYRLAVDVPGLIFM